MPLNMNMESWLKDLKTRAAVIVSMFIIHYKSLMTRHFYSTSSSLLLRGVTGQNGIGQNGTDKMVRTKCHGQNVTDKMVAISIDFNSTELNFYSVTTSQK